MAAAISTFFSRKEIITLILFLGLVITFYTFTPGHVFVSYPNLRALSRLMPDLGIVTLGIGLLMIAGEFDLSISSQIPLCSFVMITLLKEGFGILPSVLITLGVGAVLGLINAVITLKGKIPSFITTLGTMLLWRGVLYVVSGMMPIPLRPYVPNNAPIELALVSEIGVVPVQIVWFLGFALLLGLILHHHKFGNWIYATGDNENAARAMGINTDKVKTICFIIVGTLCAFVATIQLFRIESFAATQGIGFEFRAIAGCVIGGLSLRGGIGSMIGIALGAITIQIIENGLILIGVPVFGVNMFIGIAIVIFSLLGSVAERRLRIS